MDGISFTLEISGLDAALARLRATGHVEFYELLDGLARQGMDQTRRRIEIEETSPQGVAWKKTLDGRAPLFVTGAHLARSIDHAVSGDSAIWGSGWIAARIHQFGGVIKPVNGKALKFWWQHEGFVNFAVVKSVTMPARPYLGVSEQNARELEETAVRFIARYLQ
jgi:phage gpG-like protein